MEETKRMKSINKAILGMVSESLGCNVDGQLELVYVYFPVLRGRRVGYCAVLNAHTAKS